MPTNGTTNAFELSMPGQEVRRWLSRAIALVYGLVMFEVVIMASPFAFYFYAAYGPTLKWLNHSAATAWLTGFVLPHAVFTTSAFLEFLRWGLGPYAFRWGLMAFFILAVQIYGSKLVGRKTVSSGVYRYVRHPQYLCLEASAFGLFTKWPRMTIFLLWVGMLFAYYFLARIEERRLLTIDQSYAGYMRRTGMFLPGNPGGRLYSRALGGLPDQKLARGMALAILLILVLLGACFLRAYTVNHISRAAVLPDLEVVSVYPMTPAHMRELMSLALSDPSVQQALRQEGDATFVAHVLPRDYGMVGMFADVGTQMLDAGTHERIPFSRLKYMGRWLVPFLNSQVRTGIMGSDGNEYHIVFSRVDRPNGRPVSLAHLFDLSAKMTPVYIADISGVTQQVRRTIDPPRRSYWGDIKMPIF